MPSQYPDIRTYGSGCHRKPSIGELTVKIKLLPLTFFLLVLLASACENSSTPVGFREETPDQSIGADADPAIVAELPISSRSFEMGTAGFVPRHYPNSSSSDWQDFFEYSAAAYGGIFGVHVNPGEQVNEEGILEQAQLAFMQMKGVEPYIAFSVNHEDGPFTHDRGEELIRVAVAIAKKYQPKYISLGVESNSFYLFQQETFDLYVRYAREAYNEIKAASPNTMVMNNFQLEYMKGEASLTGKDLEQNWHIISMFEGRIDLVSFTVYPFLEFKTVDEIPNDYLAEILDHTSLPIMITETGWPTEDIASGVAGSNQDQTDYMMKLIKQSDDIEVEVIVWVLPHDASFGEAGGIFDHISLFDNDGNPKPGYEYWKSVNALPLQ